MAADDSPGYGEARRRLEALRRSLQSEIADLLSRLDTEGGKLVSRPDRLENAVRIRSQVFELLREDGAPVVLSVAEVASQQAADAVLTPRRARGPAGDGVAVGASFAPEAKASIRLTVSGALDDIPAVFDGAADKIRQAIDRGVNTSSSMRDLEAEVRGILDVTVDQSRVAVEAAVRGARQQALVIQAERGSIETGEETGYLYDGPEDDKNRDFCEEHIGRVYTRQALDRLDNGQGLPVMPYCGGWRCRHRLSPILIEDALAEGYEVVR